ncbi:MAG: hypothetical protein V9G18_20405 [Albidovulum sp.]
MDPTVGPTEEDRARFAAPVLLRPLALSPPSSASKMAISPRGCAKPNSASWARSRKA